MLSLRTTLLALAATTPITAEHLKVAWSAGSFSAIGDSTGNYDGFAIIRDNGDAIYNDGYPNDHSPCYNTGGGRTFLIEGDCWNTGRQFHCLGDNLGNPKNCEVRDADGNVLGSADAQSNTEFIGISIGTDATCVVEFESDDASECPVDDGNGPLHVTDDAHSDTL
ncbi:uncharacterized protein BDV14DRAFT_209074 [Aspergillus stella-maris]|uniref:uncharacterized protein n=1 Tax=Aspergillus stella-maris TaxID=1810926 RepID=UPI003CCC9A71